MKKYIILFGLSLLTSSLCKAQVSINTSSPLGIFYIDGAADNTTTSANRFKNDVMVDVNGSLVLGKATQPSVGQAKVDITSDAAYGTLKMADGGEGDGMVLFGDANGYARWGMLKGSGGYRLSLTAPTAAMATGTFYTVGFNNSLNYIPITEKGSYIVMIRMAATYTGTLGRTGGYFYLHKNTVNTATMGIDSIEMYMECLTGKKFSTYTVLRALDLAVGDKIYLVMRPQTEGTWTLDLSLTTVFFYRV
ncbi:hypothetical protein CLV62_101288 [Dysgonomonas alginatilytica]|uniref:C1q domain-containing protein n=1 Tax=Dysgonomonas alginatilytica TaxID=1605892 RepID=A0A2V3PW09_9BACT|nr:hypothetical protein [Dysgonomonas alginatilytica]PXV69021.1 hypothetical protein CLV62_101288 [Dysgonomonas alginatilytica]